MGDLIPFRRKRRWTRPQDYGHAPGAPRSGRGAGSGGKRSRLRAWLPLLFWLAVLSGLGLWVGGDPQRMEPPSFLAGEPETISGAFTLCGTARSANCVIDGDTIRIGRRSIRIVGIDAPETRDPRCEAERTKGAAATGALLALVNQGPFTMTGRIDGPRDDYGRELRALTRLRADGSEQSIADDMVRSGFARRYVGGGRDGWCPPVTQ